jgi:hypothetical protein
MVRRSPYCHLEPDDDEADCRVETRSADDAREPVALSPGKDNPPAEQGDDAHRHPKIQSRLAVQNAQRAKCERHRK